MNKHTNEESAHPARARRTRAFQTTVAACLFGAACGGCGAESGGGVGLVDFPPNVLMERWESIGPTGCKGWLTNNGSHTARDVRVFFWYRTPQGDSVLAVTPSLVNIGPFVQVAVLAPPQITHGQLRFPALGNITWAGGSSFIPGDPAPAFNWPGPTCLLTPDSARVWIWNPEGLAYDVTLRLETATSVEQIPLRQNPLGRLWCDLRNCPPAFASGCEGWGIFHAPARDSSGVKLLPKLISVRWENYAGTPDSLVLPNPYNGLGFDQDRLQSCSR